MYVPIDAEAAIAAVIAESGVSACPAPIPDGFEGSMPIAIVFSAGGAQIQPMLDEHLASIDVYASTFQDALDAARSAAGAIRRAQGRSFGAVEFKATEANPPYSNPDPRHPDAPRMTFTASVVARAI